LQSINGLQTINGLPVSVNGNPVDPNAVLPIDCGASGVPGETCWGTPDGLFSWKTGMMSSDGGIATASYLIRCALPSTQTVGFVDYKGVVLRMKGELGLAPSFYTGQCDKNCQEDISACLMAFTNASGVHVPLVMSSTKDGLGGGTNSSYPWQEGAFFGNLFQSPPAAYFCKGAGQQNIATMWYAWDASDFSARMCVGGKSNKSCPYANTGDCTGMPWSPHACTAASDGTMVSCKGGSTTWTRPITTYLVSSTAT